MVIAIGLEFEDVDIVVEGNGCEEEDDKGELSVDDDTEVQDMSLDTELSFLYTELLFK